MRAVALKRAGEAYRRAKAEKALGREDTFGTCARCGIYTYVNGHERLGGSGRRDGTKPDCLLCQPCNGWCEEWPVWSAFQGWKISGKHPRDIDLGPDEARCLDGSIHRFRAYDESEKQQ